MKNNLSGLSKSPKTYVYKTILFLVPLIIIYFISYILIVKKENQNIQKTLDDFKKYEIVNYTNTKRIYNFFDKSYIKNNLVVAISNNHKLENSIPIFLVLQDSLYKKILVQTKIIGIDNDIIYIKYGSNFLSIYQNKNTIIKRNISHYEILSEWIPIILLIYFLAIFIILAIEWIKGKFIYTGHKVSHFFTIISSLQEIVNYLFILLILFIILVGATSFTINILFLLNREYAETQLEINYSIVTQFVLLLMTIFMTMALLFWIYYKCKKITNHKIFHEVLQTIIQKNDLNDLLNNEFSFTLYEILEKINISITKGIFNYRVILLELGLILKEKNNMKSNSNRSLIFNLNTLYNLGYINFIEENMYLTSLGREKLQLPGVSFVSKIPTKYNIILELAYKDYIEGRLQDCFSKCVNNVVENFTKMAIMELYKSEPDKLQDVISRLSIKGVSIEKANLGQLETILDRKLKTIFEVNKKEALEKYNNIINLIRLIRNEYSHDNQDYNYEESNNNKTYEDFYNLIQLTRIYVGHVSRSFLNI